MHSHREFLETQFYPYKWAIREKKIWFSLVVFFFFITSSVSTIQFNPDWFPQRPTWQEGQPLFLLLPHHCGTNRTYLMGPRGRAHALLRWRAAPRQSAWRLDAAALALLWICWSWPSWRSQLVSAGKHSGRRSATARALGCCSQSASTMTFLRCAPFRRARGRKGRRPWKCWRWRRRCGASSTATGSGEVLRGENNRQRSAKGPLFHCSLNPSTLCIYCMYIWHSFVLLVFMLLTLLPGCRCNDLLLVFTDDVYLLLYVHSTNEIFDPTLFVCIWHLLACTSSRSVGVGFVRLMKFVSRHMTHLILAVIYIPTLWGHLEPINQGVHGW